MGAAPSKVQSTARSTVTSLTGTKTQDADKVVNPSEAVKDALLNNNQIIFEQDVNKKIIEVSKMFKALNDNDHKGLLKYIDTINTNLEESSKIKINDSLRSTLATFHNNILHNIDKASMTETNVNNKFVEIMKGNPENIMSVLSEKYGKDLESYKQTLLSSYGISDNAILKSNVEDIMNSVKSLKVKYKFFEYKYIELNIFMLLFIQHSYNTIEAFVSNVLAFNNLRDTAREELVKQTLQIMMSIINSADLSIKPEDFEQLSQSMEQLQKTSQKRADELDSKLKELSSASVNSISQIVSTLDEATRNSLKEELNKPKTGGSKRQDGGFVRGSTLFPQAFYDIDKIASS